MTVIGRGKSSRLLANALGCKRNQNDDIIIRYGKADYRKSRIEINKSEAINLARHKFNSLCVFKSMGISVPNFNLHFEQLKFPILGRKFYHHGGKDIQVIKSKDDFIECDYYIEFLPVQKEYRVHVFNQECISISRKVDGDENVFCRNYATGWRFKEVRIYPNEIESLAKSSVKVLGLDFGAVDIIISNSKAYVLEVNTAPGIIQKRAELYATKIKQFIGGL